ncbi:hypothetical protein Tco_0004261 [Tanacetum coccineum]
MNSPLCLQNHHTYYQWAEKIVPVAEGSSETTQKSKGGTKRNVSQDHTESQLNAEAEAGFISFHRDDNYIYSTVDSVSECM